MKCDLVEYRTDGSHFYQVAIRLPEALRGIVVDAETIEFIPNPTGDQHTISSVDIPDALIDEFDRIQTQYRAKVVELFAAIMEDARTRNAKCRYAD